MIAEVILTCFQLGVFQHRLCPTNLLTIMRKPVHGQEKIIQIIENNVQIFSRYGIHISLDDLWL
jgi:hypothetical protein